MQIRSRIKTGTPESAFDRALEQELLSYSLQNAQILNKGLQYGDNFNAEITTISDTGTANSSNTVPHTLKRVPIGFHVININKAGVVYDAGTSWTVTDIYLKCDTANCTVKLIVF